MLRIIAWEVQMYYDLPMKIYPRGGLSGGDFRADLLDDHGSDLLSEPF